MAIEFIANDAARDCAEIRVTDTSDTELDNTDDKQIFAGGPRRLLHTSTTTTSRRYVYINKSDTLGANRVIVTRADRHSSFDMEFHYWDTYTSTKTKMLDAGTGPTLCGLNGNDYIGTFDAITGKAALGMDLVGTGTKYVNNIYFGTAVSLPYITESDAISVEPVDAEERIKHGPYFWQCHERARLVFNWLTNSEVESFRNLYMLDYMPLFVYDADEEILSGKLWHCIVTQHSVQQDFDERFTLTVELMRLWEWPDYA